MSRKTWRVTLNVQTVVEVSAEDEEQAVILAEHAVEKGAKNALDGIISITVDEEDPYVVRK